MSAIPSWARVGAKVVCVRAPWSTTPEPGFAHPMVGDVLTVSGTDIRWRVGLTFAEKHPNDVYNVDNFRPLVTLSSDIAEHFEHLLDVPASHEREAEAA